MNRAQIHEGHEYAARTTSYGRAEKVVIVGVACATRNSTSRREMRDHIGTWLSGARAGKQVTLTSKQILKPWSEQAEEHARQEQLEQHQEARRLLALQDNEQRSLQVEGFVTVLSLLNIDATIFRRGSHVTQEGFPDTLYIANVPQIILKAEEAQKLQMLLLQYVPALNL